MKKLSVLLIFCLTGVIATALFAQAQLSQNIITIQTPEKKSDGKDTSVVFDHKKHADEYAKGCDKCHPALKQAVNAPENTKDIVHTNCKQCHDKDKPGKSFTCSLCHKVPA